MIAFIFHHCKCRVCVIVSRLQAKNRAMCNSIIQRPISFLYFKSQQDLASQILLRYLNFCLKKTILTELNVPVTLDLTTQSGLFPHCFFLFPNQTVLQGQSPGVLSSNICPYLEECLTYNFLKNYF